MALFNLPKQTGIGELLGTGLGQGLGAATQGILQQKLAQLGQQQQQRQTFQGLQSLGYQPQEASQLAMLPPQLLNEVVKQRLKQPQQEAFAQQLQSLLGGGQSEPSGQIDFGTQEPGAQQLPQGMQGQQASQQAGLPQQQGVQKPLPRLTEQQATKLAELGLKQKKLGIEEKKEARREEARRQEAIQKDTKAFFDQTISEQKQAKETTQTLAKMEKLIDKGNLPPAALYKFVKDIEKDVTISSGAAAGGALGAALGSAVGGAGAVPGGVIGAGIGAMIKPIASLVESGIKYTYPDTEEFEKLSNSMIRGARQIFGQRITNADLEVFMQTIPNLTQTENGKRQIINNMKSLTEAAEVRGNALKEIMKENQGKRPDNLALLVDERAEKELDRLAEEFISG